MEANPLIYSANQLTGFYMIGTTTMNELNDFVVYHKELWIFLWFIITSARVYVALGM